MTQQSSQPGVGHNSKPVRQGGIAADRLKSFVERIEKLTEEKQALQGDISDIYSEAKGVGFDTRTLRKIVALRKLDAADLSEQNALLETYGRALGMSVFD